MFLIRDKISPRSSQPGRQTGQKDNPPIVWVPVFDLLRLLRAADRYLAVSSHVRKRPRQRKSAESHLDREPHIQRNTVESNWSFVTMSRNSVFQIEDNPATAEFLRARKDAFYTSNIFVRKWDFVRNVWFIMFCRRNTCVESSNLTSLLTTTSSPHTWTSSAGNRRTSSVTSLDTGFPTWT